MYAASVSLTFVLKVSDIIPNYSAVFLSAPNVKCFFVLWLIFLWCWLLCQVMLPMDDYVYHSLFCINYLGRSTMILPCLFSNMRWYVTRTRQSVARAAPIRTTQQTPLNQNGGRATSTMLYCTGSSMNTDGSFEHVDYFSKAVKNVWCVSTGRERSPIWLLLMVRIANEGDKRQCSEIGWTVVKIVLPPVLSDDTSASSNYEIFALASLVG